MELREPALPLFTGPRFGTPPGTPASAAREAKTVAARNGALLDAGLVRRFNAGDESAFDEIMHRHEQPILHFLLSFIRNHADAEEIAEDTFICAHRGLGRFRGDSSLATWLHHIAMNLSRNHYWFFHRRRHLAGSLDTPLAPGARATLAETVAADTADPAEAAALAEFSTVLARCMEKLPHQQREVLALRGLLDRSYADIATALGIKVGTVKSRIARARRNLHAQVNSTCPEFGPTDAVSCGR